MKTLLKNFKWKYIINIFKNMIWSLYLSLLLVFCFIGLLETQRYNIPFKTILYFIIPIWILIFVRIIIKNILNESIPIGNLWTDVFDDLPMPGLMNENTQDYQQYMCLVKISDKMDVRPLMFSENKRWLHGGIDMTVYVIAWEKLPNFPNITEVVKE